MPKILDQWFDEDAEMFNISPLHVVNTLKKMGASKERIRAVRSRGNACDSISKALNLKCLKKWKFSSYLGSGNNGIIFSVVNNSGTTRAAKIVTVDPKSEVKVQKKLAKVGIAPKVYHTCKLADRLWVVIMEKIDGSLGDLVGGHRSLSTKSLKRIYDEIIRNIEAMEKQNISHGDLSLENLGYIILPDGEIRVIVIDFGWSSFYVPMFDMVSLTQALLFTRNKKNRDYLYNNMSKYIKDVYDYKLPGSVVAIDVLFRDFQDKFIHEMMTQ